MNNVEATKIIAKLRKLWPDWMPTEYETDIWVKRLSSFEEYIATKTIDDLYVLATRKKPSLNKYLELLRIAGQRDSSYKGKEKPEPVLAYRIYCEQHPEQEYPFYLPKLPDPIPSDDAFMRDADWHREKFIEIYGGNWIVIQDWTLLGREKPEPELVGEPARKQAEVNILAGPDTPGRRFLQRFRSSKKPERKENEPEHIGSVIEDTIPF